MAVGLIPALSAEHPTHHRALFPGSLERGGMGRFTESRYRVRSKDGSTRRHLARGTLLSNREGGPVRFIGTSADTTDLKRAEEALRESERRFRIFVDHASEAFFLLDDQHVILDVRR